MIPHKYWLLALVAVVTLATGGRWYSARQLYDPPAGKVRLSGDELVFIVVGDGLIRHGTYSARPLLQVPGFADRVYDSAYVSDRLFKHPPLYPLLVGLSRRLSSAAPMAPVLPSVFLGAVSLVGVFWLVMELRGSPAQGLLAVFLLAVSPVHWICSSRVWLDIGLTAFVVLALAAHVRALNDARWWRISGLLWGCALLTKYTALPLWLASVGASLILHRPARQRPFWLGHGIALSILAAWLAVRVRVEGATLFALWPASGNEWQQAAALLRLWWLLVPAACLVWGFTWVVRRYREQWTPANLLYAATALFVAALAVIDLEFVRNPWFGWGVNPFRAASPTFYLTRQVTLEPVAWLGFAGMLALRPSTDSTIVRAAWVTLLIFLSIWGNYQSRYGLPLIPFAHVWGAWLLTDAARGDRRPYLRRILATLWVVLSSARSLWIIQTRAFGEPYVYF